MKFRITAKIHQPTEFEIFKAAGDYVRIDHANERVEIRDAIQERVVGEIKRLLADFVRQNGIVSMEFDTETQQVAVIPEPLLAKLGK